MSLHVNNKNVVSYCFVVNAEIKLLRDDPSAEKFKIFHNIKCPTPSNSQICNTSHPKRVNQHHVVTTAVSNDGNFVAASDTSNFLHIWEMDGFSWKYLCNHTLIRKCHKIIFTNAGSEMIVADRGGDVYSYNISDHQQKGKFLLGHISLIIDIAMSSDDAYLLTSDRDGKIRISHYPNCYNIYSYCLGHQEFVSSVQCLNLSEELILSSSGDGSIKLWNFEGVTIGSVNLYDSKDLLDKMEKCGVFSKSTDVSCENSLPCVLNENQIAFAVKRICYSANNHICVVQFYSVTGIAIYHITDEKDNYFKFIEFVSLDSVPFDVFFDEEKNLVILMKREGQQFLYFKLDVENKISLNKIDSSEVKISKDVEKLLGNLSDLTEVPEDYETLFKRHYDNDEKEEDMEAKTEMSKKMKNS